MASAAAPGSASAAAPAATSSSTSPSDGLPVWHTLSFEGPGNSLQQIRVHVGMRVRIDLVDEAPSGSDEGGSLPSAKATIRYVGPVAAAKDPHATMVGVEWDEAWRGKNDGTVGGRTYFTCAQTTQQPGSVASATAAAAALKPASFLHPARLQRGSARALDTAISNKYQTQFQQTASQGLYLVAQQQQQKSNNNVAPSPSPSPSTDAMPTPSSSSDAAASSPSAGGGGVGMAQRHIPVVFQGEEYMQRKIANQLAQTKDMTLPQGDIYLAFEEDPILTEGKQTLLEAGGAGAADAASLQAAASARLARKIPQCQTLDLTDNLLMDWRQVGLLTRALPRLKLLALNQNNLRRDTLLFLGRTQAEPSGPEIPSSPVPAPVLDPLFSQAFHALEVLVLNTVPQAWTAVLLLAQAGAVPNMQEVHLCKNNLTSLRGEAAEILQVKLSQTSESTSSSSSSSSSSAADVLLRQRLAACLPSLHTLELSHNNLSDWAGDVCLFEQLPGLSKLLLNQNQIEHIQYEYQAPDAASTATTHMAAAAVSASSQPAVDLYSAAASACPSSSSPVPFARLESLGLNNNRLASFASVDALARFPTLRELRLQANPALEQETVRLNAGGNITASSPPALNAAAAGVQPAGSDPAAAGSCFVSSRESSALLRLQLVARLPRLVALNRSSITVRERSDAERYYILVAFQVMMRKSNEAQTTAGAASSASTSAASAASPTSPVAAPVVVPSSDAINSAFTRYGDLVGVYGDPAATVHAMAKQSAEPAGTTIASKLVELTWMLVEPCSNGEAGGENADASSSSSSSSAAAAAAAASALPPPGTRLVSSLSKRVSSTLTVQSVRSMMEKSFKLPAHMKNKYTFDYREPFATSSGSGEQAAAATDNHHRPGTIHNLDEPMRTLGYYEMAQGGALILRRKP